MARPSLCVLAVLLIALVTAPAARAALEPPVLTGTNPASPSASLTPLVVGEIPEEGGAKGVGAAALLGGAGPIALAAEPDNTVTLYTEAGCTGPVAGEGKVEDLEGTGVQVSSAVAADAVTTFFAKQDDGEETSACSSVGLEYRQVTTPPGAPVLESVSPSSPANYNFPHLIGTADADATVLIYVGAGCGGSAVKSGSGALFGTEGIQVEVADNSETTFSAKASLAGFESGCSDGTIVYREVTPEPEPEPESPGEGEGGGGSNAPVALAAPRLRTIPGGWANDNAPLVVGSAPGASLVKVFADGACQGPAVARVSAAQFAAGVPIGVADNVAVAFSAKSVAGSTSSPCSRPAYYFEDSLRPRVRITFGPAFKTSRRKVVFRFADASGSRRSTIFRCKVDRGKWRRCKSPLRLKKLRPRRHVLRIKAVDRAGNRQKRATKRRFKVIRRGRG